MSKKKKLDPISRFTWLPGDIVVQPKRAKKPKKVKSNPKT